MRFVDLRWICVVGLLLPASAGAQDRAARAIPEGQTARERFSKLIERARVPLNAAEKPATTVEGFQESAFEFDSEAGQRVPGVVVKSPAPMERRPAVIVMHGTGGSKDGMKTLLRRFAAEGLIAVAIDGRWHGQRAGGKSGSEAYRAAILETWKTGQGFPFFYDTVWDVMRLIDYLETRTDVDPKRIGAIGFSKGGIELYLAAAADPRIAAAVPCIGVQSFAWALEHDMWQSRIETIQSAADSAAREAGVPVAAPFVKRFYERVVPGIHKEFDGPVMLPLIAPRPLLVINGEKDARTPTDGLKLCIDAGRAAYDRAGAGKQFEFVLQPNTGHAVTAESERYAIGWLREKLK